MEHVVGALRANLGRAIRGKPREIDLLIAAFLAGGNVLLNDVPGVGKTTLAKAFARSIGGVFARVQFTPDLLPADILGGSLYNPQKGSFEVRQGPIFANVLLADEINRASPRTQSALLEAMAEGQVSLEGRSLPLPQPFWVIATQNPIEHHGTYPLPEAQLDRFAIELSLGYPAPDEETAILVALVAPVPSAGLDAVVGLADVVRAREQVARLHVDRDLCAYAVALCEHTRADSRLRLGASPRGSIALVRLAQGHAAVAGRTHATPDDVKAVAVYALAHRVALDTKARYAGVRAREVIEDALARVRVPA